MLFYVVVFCLFIFFFFFKQKTAYELRISDWSSDVCSSDLYISRYHNRRIDLMDLLAKYNGRANAPLDDLAKLCGFPGKLGMDGSQVWKAWSQGQAGEVRAYCETDVVNT